MYKERMSEAGYECGLRDRTWYLSVHVTEDNLGWITILSNLYNQVSDSELDRYFVTKERKAFIAHADTSRHHIHGFHIFASFTGKEWSFEQKEQMLENYSSGRFVRIDFYD